jgi:hypothetical protein
VIASDGTFHYAVPTDTRALTELGTWLRARAYPLLAVTVVVALGVVVAGLATSSVLLVALGAGLLFAHPVLVVVRLRTTRRTLGERFGPTWGVAFGPQGVRVDARLTSTTCAWAYFAAWTLHRGQLVLVHSGLHAIFVSVPIGVVPEDEWQPLTSLLYERLGPARKPDSVRGGRLTPSTPHQSDDPVTLHP